jgi:hypothetical protein
MAEKRKADQLSENEIAEREEIASEFFANSVKIRQAEKRLKDLKMKQKSFLAKHPFLANSVGALHKGAFSTPAQGEGKKRKTEMEVDRPDESNKATGSTPRKRLEKLIGQKQAGVQQQAKVDQAQSNKEGNFNKFQAE